MPVAFLCLGPALSIKDRLACLHTSIPGLANDNGGWDEEGDFRESLPSTTFAYATRVKSHLQIFESTCSHIIHPTAIYLDQ